MSRRKCSRPIQIMIAFLLLFLLLFAPTNARHFRRERQSHCQRLNSLIELNMNEKTLQCLSRSGPPDPCKVFETGVRTSGTGVALQNAGMDALEQHYENTETAMCMLLVERMIPAMIDEDRLTNSDGFVPDPATDGQYENTNVKDCHDLKQSKQALDEYWKVAILEGRHIHSGSQLDEAERDEAEGDEVEGGGVETVVDDNADEETTDSTVTADKRPGFFDGIFGKSGKKTDETPAGDTPADATVPESGGNAAFVSADKEDVVAGGGGSGGSGGIGGIGGSGANTAETAVVVTLEEDTSAGATKIPMMGADGKGFKIGQTIAVGEGEHAEERNVVGFGPLILDKSLEYDHKAGEPIVVVKNVGEASCKLDKDCLSNKCIGNKGAYVIASEGKCAFPKKALSGGEKCTKDFECKSEVCKGNSGGLGDWYSGICEADPEPMPAGDTPADADGAVLGVTTDKKYPKNNAPVDGTVAIVDGTADGIVVPADGNEHEQTGHEQTGHEQTGREQTGREQMGDAEILGVKTDATMDELKKKWIALSLKCHPDKCKYSECKEATTGTNGNVDSETTREKEILYCTAAFKKINGAYVNLKEKLTNTKRGEATTSTVRVDGAAISGEAATLDGNTALLHNREETTTGTSRSSDGSAVFVSAGKEDGCSGANGDPCKCALLQGCMFEWGERMEIYNKNEKYGSCVLGSSRPPLDGNCGPGTDDPDICSRMKGCKYDPAKKEKDGGECMPCQNGAATLDGDAALLPEQKAKVILPEDVPQHRFRTVQPRKEQSVNDIVEDDAERSEFLMEAVGERSALQGIGDSFLEQTESLVTTFGGLLGGKAATTETTTSGTAETPSNPSWWSTDESDCKKRMQYLENIDYEKEKDTYDSAKKRCDTAQTYLSSYVRNQLGKPRNEIRPKELLDFIQDQDGIPKHVNEGLCHLYKEDADRDITVRKKDDDPAVVKDDKNRENQKQGGAKCKVDEDCLSKECISEDKCAFPEKSLSGGEKCTKNFECKSEVCEGNLGGLRGWYSGTCKADSES